MSWIVMRRMRHIRFEERVGEIRLYASMGGADPPYVHSGGNIAEGGIQKPGFSRTWFLK